LGGQACPCRAKKASASCGRPAYATRPSASSITWSNIENSCEDGWWIVQMMAVPRRASCCSVDTSACAPYESRPVVGSSQNSSVGLVSSSVANASRFFSPPDSILPSPASPMRVPAHRASPTRSSRSRIVWSIARWPTRRSSRSFAMKYMCSCTVSEPTNRSSWCTNPLSRYMYGPTGCPFTRMSPWTTVPAKGKKE
uniref:Uncharacterized protein n=1 Tax=Anopheles coluzzii TaxID=1518534 RepID=A0A8W7PZ86_ANOCL